MNKLSRHVLGMKFMRRSKDQFEKKVTESTFRHHFQNKKEEEADEKPFKSEVKIETTCDILEVNSYSQCEGHIFGRQSFGGFNPVVESNVKKGIWKPFYLDEQPEEESEDDDDSDEDNEDDDDEKEVSNKEMAKTFGSLVGTLGRKFMGKKRKRKGEKKIEVKNEGEGGKRKNKKNKKREVKIKKEEVKEPPNKKRKFMKPKADD